MNGKRASQIAFVLCLLIVSTPASGDFVFRESGGFFDDLASDKQKTIRREIEWVWRPQYPGGAPGGYLIFLDCKFIEGDAGEFVDKKGKATAKEISLTGVDDGMIVGVGKITAKIKQGIGRGTKTMDLSSLAGQSAVIASAQIRVGKNIGPDQRAKCEMSVIEWE